MRDFNFFEPYIKVQTKPKRNIILLVVLAALTLAVLVYYQYLLISHANDIKSEIDEINTFLTSADTTSKISNIEGMQTRLESLQTAFTDLNAMTVEIETSSQLDDMLLEQINSQLPNNTFLSEVAYKDAILTIKGYSTEFSNISQFAYNLRNSGGITDVLIPTIYENNGNYEFSITAKMMSGGAQ